MNILIDLVHPSDVNLFKNAISQLSKDGHKIFITLRERGKLYLIAKDELKNFELVLIGKHEHGFINKVIALIKREIDLYRYIKRNKIDISVNQGFSSVLSCRFIGIPFLQFEDDFEYKLAFYYNKLLATRDIMPDYIPTKGRNIYKYHGFKELAYLHPSVFIPNKGILSELKITQFRYVFIREISNISLNYSNRTSYLDEIVNFINAKDLQIVLSLEDKSLSGHYKDRCIILQEPVQDIYSLMANALLCISSGDTMAREACLLSTPSIYTGGREMLMNTPLIQKGIMYKEDSLEMINERLRYMLKDDNALSIRSGAKKAIGEEWEYTTDVILKHIKDFNKA